MINKELFDELNKEFNFALERRNNMGYLPTIIASIFIIIAAVKGEVILAIISLLWWITEMIVLEANISLKKKKKHYDDEATRLIKAVEREFKDEQK